MRFTVISILFASLMLSSSTFGQPSPDQAKKWEDTTAPKIKAQFNRALERGHLKPSSKTILFARAYLERDGSIRNLRIDKSEESTDLPKQQLARLEKAFLTAIRNSAPLQYGNRADSLLKHVGLYVRYIARNDLLEAGMTHPEDTSAP